jgi:selenocysteine-specific elongation factor
VLRSPSPPATIGGGIVVDPLAPARARAAHAVDATPHQSLRRLLDEAGVAGVAASELPVRLGRSSEESAALARGDDVWRVSDRLFAASIRDALAASILAIVARYHAEHPLEIGAPQQWLRSRLGAADATIDAVLAVLVRRGAIVVEQGIAREPGFAPTLTPRQRALSDTVLQRLEQAGIEPPSIDELAVELGIDTVELASLARVLAREGSVVAVEPNRYFLMGSVDQLVGSLLCGMSQNVDYGPSELRPLIGLTRKFLIPFLEYCDREGYTTRDGLGRRRAGTRLAKG